MIAIVTGSEGFIGGHLCKALEAAGHTVIGRDQKSGNDILFCDLPDADRVFHLAAQTDATYSDMQDDAETNIMGTLRILDRYREKVVFASSSAVNHPLTPYAISKLAGEMYARSCGAAIVRLCNVFGAGGHGVFEKFREAETLKIYGDGNQVRTYTHVANAVDYLMKAGAGTTTIVPGTDMTVNQIAAQFSKPREYLPARAGEVFDGRQVA